MAVHRLLPKTVKDVLLITSDAPTTTGITCVLWPHLIELNLVPFSELDNSISMH